MRPDTLPTEPVCIAYLTGEYPKASHTFILREIVALRALGARVISASVRRPPSDNLIGEEEEAAAAETFYVLSEAKKPVSLLRAQAELLARSPGRYFKALSLAMRSGRPGLKGFVWQIFYFLEATVLARHVQDQGATHLHNHFADSSANVAMLAAMLAGVKFSFTLHGPAELFEPTSWHLGTKISQSAFTVCISHFARSQAMLFSNPDDWHKLKIVHCGVTPMRYDAPLRGATEGLKLLFVGRLTAIKGLRVLVEALDSLRTTHPDVSLTVIGDGEDRSWLEAQAKRLGNVTLLGFQSQSGVAQALVEADALVLPSFAEGVPVVLMEAMASARPVIATRVGGVSELVEDGNSGYMVAPGDADDLAKAIAALHDAPETRAKMGQAGREKVHKEFDIDKEAARLLTLFQGTLGNSPRAPDQAEKD